MKTKVVLLIAALMLGFSAWSNNGDKKIVGVCAPQSVQSKLKNEINKWDLSKVQENSSTAVVAFKITGGGNIEIEDIGADNADFKEVVRSNFSKVNLNTCDANTQTVYYIKISFRKV